MIKKDDGSGRLSYSDFNILNAFNRIYYRAQYLSRIEHCMKVRFEVNGFGTSIELPSSCVAFAQDRWQKVSVSVKRNLDSTFDFYVSIF